MIVHRGCGSWKWQFQHKVLHVLSIAIRVRNYTGSKSSFGFDTDVLDGTGTQPKFSNALVLGKPACLIRWSIFLCFCNLFSSANISFKYCLGSSIDSKVICETRKGNKLYINANNYNWPKLFLTFLLTMEHLSFQLFLGLPKSRVLSDNTCKPVSVKSSVSPLCPSPRVSTA